MTPKIGSAELAAIAELVRAASGIALDQTKGYLLETRLGALLDEHRLAGWSELARAAQRDARLKAQIVDALTTNETSFFRDSKTFDLLAHKLIPAHYERFGAHAPLRVWSAACSTGQEIYTLAIVLRELFGPLAGRRITIVGTDISPTALAAASKGSYSALEVSRGLSPRRLERHFVAEGSRFRIRDELRGLVSYKELNLLDAPQVARLGVFDFVFCRNVAIYFNDVDRGRLFAHISKALSPQGVLLLGLTETLRGAGGGLQREHLDGVTFYRRAESPAVALRRGA